MAGEYVYKYYIVGFLEKPYDTVDLEVCVPYGWMKLDKRGQNHSVAYPAEYSLFTKQLVQNNCWVQKGWRYYKVKVQFGSDSFTEAEEYIKSRNNNEPQKTKCSNTEVESKSATKRKTLSLNQSPSLGPAAKECRTKIPHLGNNRTDQKGRLCIEQPVPPISMKELLKKQAKPIEIYKSTTDVEMSTVTNNTVEQTVLERSATKESALIQASQSCQPLTDPNEENLPTVVNDKNYKLNVIDDKPECLNTSKAKAKKRKHERKRKKPSKSKNLSYIPFFSFTHPSIIKQIQLAYATIGCDLNISFDKFVSNYLSDESHKHQTPAWYTESSHSQSQQGLSSAKDKILEENVTVTSYSKAPNPSSLVPSISHNNPSSTVNKPILCHNQHQENMSVAKSIHAYDNVQQSCPKLTIVKTPSALYRLQNKIARHYQLSSHTHSNQFLTINKTHSYQEPRVQEILDRSIGVNSRDQSAHSQSATHQEPYIQQTLHRSTVEIPIEQSHISQSTTRNGNVIIPVDVKIPINRTPSCTEEKRQFSEKILNKSPKILFSSDHENHTLEKGSLQNLNTEISIRIGNVDKNSQHQKNTQNTPSAVKNTSNSSKHSTCPLNGSSGKQNSVVTQDLFIIEPHDQERRSGKQSNLNHTEKGIHSKSNKENESCPVLSDLDTKESFKKQLLLAYQYLIQEQSSSTTKNSLDLKMPKEEITVEKTGKDHNESTTCAQNETEHHHQSEINNLFNNNHKPTRVKESRLDTIDLIEQLKMNNVDVSISDSPQKPEESPTNNENKKSNVETNYIAVDDHDGKNNVVNDNDNGYFINVNRTKDDGVENDSHNELQTQKHGSNRAFVLPPEYNPNDSRWTLKYPAIVPGVVELIAGSNIYVSETKLHNCTRVANNYRILGRMLLVEIFSQNALSVCSLSGRNQNALNIRESGFRPGLDRAATTNLLKYLEIYGFRKGWGQFHLKSIVTSLRNRINEIRCKNRA